MSDKVQAMTDAELRDLATNIYHYDTDIQLARYALALKGAGRKFASAYQTYAARANQDRPEDWRALDEALEEMTALLPDEDAGEERP